MVQYKIAAVGLIAALVANVSHAFSPSNPAARKVELARTKVENMYGSDYMSMIGDGMKMVSGGANAEEYYEGALLLLFTVSVVLPGTVDEHIIHACISLTIIINIHPSIDRHINPTQQESVLDPHQTSHPSSSTTASYTSECPSYPP